MKLFSSLFHSRDKPKNSTAGIAYRFYMGSSTAGKNVTERSAMQMTAVYSCVRVLSEAVAGLPLHVYKYRSDGGNMDVAAVCPKRGMDAAQQRQTGGKEKAIDHSLYRLLRDEPNPEMTSFVFRETLMTHLLLWGNAYAQVIRNGKGEVVALYPLMPNRMTVDRDSKLARWRLRCPRFKRKSVLQILSRFRRGNPQQGVRGYSFPIRCVAYSRTWV